MPADRPVFIVSDHTGLTAENIAKALLVHFPEQQFRYERRPFTKTVAAAHQIVQEVEDLAAQAEAGLGLAPIVFTTITEQNVVTMLKQAPAEVFDLLTDSLNRLERQFQEPPRLEVGGLHDMQNSEQYTSRIEALDFALLTDDGVNEKHYGVSDVILVAVSRAGKTPTSLYLALQHGIRASNYPLAEDDFERNALPIPLDRHRRKLFGLTIDPRRLHAIRTARKANSKYASLEQCEFEVRQAERLFQRYAIPVRDTTSASIEEIATSILTHLREK